MSIEIRVKVSWNGINPSIIYVNNQQLEQLNEKKKKTNWNSKEIELIIQIGALNKSKWPNAEGETGIRKPEETEKECMCVCVGGEGRWGGEPPELFRVSSSGKSY